MSVARDTVAGLAVRRNSDARLLDHALRGDAVAFSEIHRRFSGRVFAFCLARLMSVDAAQDATQEVFLRLLSADPDKVRSISGWMFGVARHVCIDVARSRQRTVPTDSSAIEVEIGAHRAESSAEDEALSKAEAGDIFLALRRMQPRYRSVLVLRELHGQSVSEIANALTINTGTAYTLLSRARDAFGKAYSETRELPAQCRDAVELLYRETGSGISESEAEKLDAHLAHCTSCSREARHAKERPLFAGLLPLLPGQRGLPYGQLVQAVGRLGSSVPSLTTAAGAAPSSTLWVSAVVGTAVAAAVLLGVAAVPTGSQVGSTPERDGAVQVQVEVPTSISAGGDWGYEHTESQELRAQQLAQRRMQVDGKAATDSTAGQGLGGTGQAGREESPGARAPRASQDSGGSSQAAGTKDGGGADSHSSLEPVTKKAPTGSGAAAAAVPLPEGSSKGAASGGTAIGSPQGEASRVGAP